MGTYCIQLKCALTQYCMIISTSYLGSNIWADPQLLGYRITKRSADKPTYGQWILELVNRQTVHFKSNTGVNSNISSYFVWTFLWVCQSTNWLTTSCLLAKDTLVSDVDRVERFRLTEIFRRRVDGVVIYFFNSDFKFFDDASQFSFCSFYVVFIFS